MADPLLAGPAKHVLQRMEQILQMPFTGADAAAGALAKELRSSKVPKPLLSKAIKMARHMGIAYNLERHFTAQGSAKWLKSFDATMDSIELAMQPTPPSQLHSAVSGFALPFTEGEETSSPVDFPGEESKGASSEDTTYVEEQPDQPLVWFRHEDCSGLEAGSHIGSPLSRPYLPQASGSKNEGTSETVPFPWNSGARPFKPMPAGRLSALAAFLAPGQAEVEWDPKLLAPTTNSESDVDEDAYTNNGYSELGDMSDYSLPSSKPSSPACSYSDGSMNDIDNDPFDAQADECAFLTVKELSCLAWTSSFAFEKYYPIVARNIDKKCAAFSRRPGPVEQGQPFLIDPGL